MINLYRTFHDDHAVVYINVKQIQQTPLDYISHGGLPKEISEVRKSLRHKCHNINKWQTAELSLNIMIIFVCSSVLQCQNGYTAQSAPAQVTWELRYA